MKKINRLLKNNDFQEVISKQQKQYNSSFTMYFCSYDQNICKIGISVSKKIGHAVLRNKIKRQVRMMCQDIFPIDANIKVVLIISKNYIQNSYQENYRNLHNIFMKINSKEKTHEKETI